jgi:hypothetical protein
MINRLFGTIIASRSRQRRADLYRNLIRREAKIGGQVFGSVAQGHLREFFCLDEHTWVWHEEWKDQTGQQNLRVTRYDVRPDGILKSQNGQYIKLSALEAKRLVKAAELYVGRVKNELYAHAL